MGAPDWGIFGEWHRRIAGSDPDFAPLGHVSRVLEPLARIEVSIRESVWNAQRHHTLHASRSVAALGASLERKHVTFRYVVPRRVAEHRCPLLSSIEPEARLAPVAHPMMICDGRRVILGDSTGETVWTSVAPDVVADAVAFYERLWGSAEPAVPEGEQPPYTPRMVQIAYRLVDGCTDREIARALGVSERTVSADVREMSRRLGARSRAHAIALIAGLEG